MVENLVPEVYPYLEAGTCGGEGAPPWELATKNKVPLFGTLFGCYYSLYRIWLQLDITSVPTV